MTGFHFVFECVDCGFKTTSQAESISHEGRHIRVDAGYLARLEDEVKRLTAEVADLRKEAG